MFVVRTLTLCSQILEMWSTYPHGRSEIQTAKIALHFTERPLTTVVTLCMLSLETARSCHSLGMILDQRFLESTNPDRIGQGRFSRLLLFFSGFSLLSLYQRSSLSVFAGVQDVVHLVFHVSIKWEAALLVHHFVVRQRLIESAFRWVFVSVI